MKLIQQYKRYSRSLWVARAKKALANLERKEHTPGSKYFVGIHRVIKGPCKKCAAVAKDVEERFQFEDERRQKVKVFLKYLLVISASVLLGFAIGYWYRDTEFLWASIDIVCANYVG